MPDTHIVVFEPDSNGDQMEYVGHFANSVMLHVRRPRITLLTSAETASHVVCRQLANDFSGVLTIGVAPKISEGHFLLRKINRFYEQQWKNAEALTRGLARIGPKSVDFVFFPYLETVGLPQLAFRRDLFHGRPWAAIAHNLRFHHRAIGIKAPFEATEILRRVLFWRVLRDPGLLCLGTVDPYLSGTVAHEKVLYCPPRAIAPKPASVADARSAYGIRPETCVILVFGFIDRRKCVDVLLDGVARIAADVDVTVLLAGVQNARDLAPVMGGPAARKLREQDRLIEVNRFIDPERDIDPMNAADIVWVFYDRSFVRHSDVLTRSAMARLPVVVRDQGLIGRAVADHRLGLAIATDAPEAIAEVLTRLARDPSLRRTLGENGAQAFGRNTPENLMRPIVDAVARTLRIGEAAVS